MAINVDAPDHYVNGREIEPIEVILDWDLSYLEGNILKYLSRWRRKGTPIDDLRKLHRYVHILLEREQRKAGQ